MDCQHGEKSRVAKEQIYMNHSGPFLIVFFSFSLHPPPFLLTRFIFLFRCNLPPSSLSLFLSLYPSGSLCLVVSMQPDPTPHRQQPGWYPALNSPVHCNSATMSTRSVVDGQDPPPSPPPPTPSAVSGTCQTEAGGRPLVKVFLWGWIVPSLAVRNQGQLESVRFQSQTWSRIVCF